MIKQKISLFVGTFAIVFVASAVIFSGCSGENKPDPGNKNPQLVVNPDSVRLGVATLYKTDVVFAGSGFNPGEVMLIEMVNVPVIDGSAVDIPVANAQVEKDGTFRAEMGPVTKISEFIRAQLDAINNVIIITGPTMPEGTYEVQVTSLMSDRAAKCSLTVKGPSIIDSIKDWIGEKMGKIVRKEKGNENDKQN